MNENIAGGKWLELKGRMKETWGQISDDEFEKTKGNVASLVGLLQQKLGYTQDEASEKFYALMDKLNFKAEQVQDYVTDKFKEGHRTTNKKLDNAKDSLSRQ